MQENLTTQDLRDYAEARVQADRAARQAELCAWMQNIDAALQEPLFHELRAVMGTENMGQDMALLQTLRRYRAKAPLPAAKALTDREALMLAAQAGIKMKTGASALKLIRATEAHYGIKAIAQAVQPINAEIDAKLDEASFHYEFVCYSCAQAWEARIPEADCASCGTTNHYSAKNAAPSPVAQAVQPS